MSSPSPLVGSSPPRADGIAKVSGAARYVDDLRPPGCLYGATVRSTRAHARVRGLTLDPAFDWSGVTVATARDVPGENFIYLMTEDQPALADGLVRHSTEPIALVAAESRDRALAAVKHVRVDYEDLPAILDAETAEGNPTQIFGVDNVYKRITVDKVPAGGPVSEDGLIIVEGTYTMGLQEQLYIEPQGMIAIPREDGGMTLVGSMQCPYYIHKALKRVLGHERINVVQAATGGGFGGKEEYPSMLAAHCAILAQKTGRPVKIIYRRDEDLRCTTKRHPARITLRSASRPDGTLVKWEADLLFDGGAYNTLTPVVLSRATLHATGPYRCEEVHLRGVAVATHTPPNGAFRGFGAPQAMFAAERHIDAIARALGRDPVDLRAQLLFTEGDITATGQTLVAPGGEAVLREALDAAQAPLPPVIPPACGGHASRLAPGRGLALVFHGCGFTGNGEAWLKGKVGVGLSGDRVTIYTASTDIGQGVDTTFIQIVADELGLPAHRVTMSPHDTDLVPDSGPTVASRTCMVVGGVAKIAASKLRAALQAETGASDTDFDALLAARSLSADLYVQHEYEDDGKLIWDGDTYQGDAYPTFGWSACVVDLDVDRDTGEVHYRRFISATDVGKAIHPIIVTGQIEGGSLQALGWATQEEVILDDQGAMKNNRLTNYIIPTSLDAPEMVTRIVEIPYEKGPFGAKGIGEIPMDGPAAAVAQAIEAATGAVLNALPLSPERVLSALPST
jgi:CO/xanthine dehydrogenase Mo-binding subunit